MALAKAWKYFQYHSINKCVFDNNDIHDYEFSKILEAIKNLDDFKKIVYKNNEFSYMSLD